MNEHTAFDRQLQELIAAYADRAPIDVDAVQIAHSAANARAATRQPWPSRLVAGPAFVWVVTVGILIAAAGAGLLLFAGAPAATVAPSAAATAVPTPGSQVGFAGLAPDGSEPSMPASAAALLDYHARSLYSVPCCGKLDFQLYGDGRVIWEQEPTSPQGRVNGSIGLIEQRLSPLGVSLLTAALESGLPDASAPYLTHSGFVWGFATFFDGAGEVTLQWGDSHVGEVPEVSGAEREALLALDARLRDLTAWLPAEAWDDASLRGFVPARYEACVPGGKLGDPDALPERARDLVLRGAPSSGTPAAGGSPEDCRRISLSDAWDLVDLLAESGFAPIDDGTVTFISRIPGGPSVEVHIDAVLPNGDVRCRCG